MISLYEYLMIAAILMTVGLLGLVINRKNILVALMCVELMLLAANTNFLAFSHYLHNLAGNAFVFFVLTVAAAEAAIGLAIVVTLHRQRSSIEIGNLNTLKG